MSDPSKKQSFDARISDKREVSSRIGETCRFIAFGLVALVFTLLSSETKYAIDLVNTFEIWVSLAGFLGCSAILCDYLQYICGYFSVNDALRQPERSFKYDSKSICYRGREVFFWCKQIFAFSGALLVTTITALDFLKL